MSDSSMSVSLISPLSAIYTRLHIIFIIHCNFIPFLPSYSYPLFISIPYHFGEPLCVPHLSIKYTTSNPSKTVPKATNFLSRYATFAYRIKHRLSLLLLLCKTAIDWYSFQHWPLLKFQDDFGILQMSRHRISFHKLTIQLLPRQLSKRHGFKSLTACTTKLGIIRVKRVPL